MSSRAGALSEKERAAAAQLRRVEQAAKQVRELVVCMGGCVGA